MENSSLAISSWWNKNKPAEKNVIDKKKSNDTDSCKNNQPNSDANRGVTRPAKDMKVAVYLFRRKP